MASSSSGAKVAHNEDADRQAFIDKLLAQMAPQNTSENASKIVSSFELAAKDKHRTIGLGKFGRVFVARGKGTSGSNVVLALKEILAPAAAQEFMTFKAALTSLMPVFAKLRHPNIAQVYRYELILHPQQPRRLIIFREFCPGKSMSAWASSENLSDEIVRKYSRQLTDAVAYLHTQKPPIFHGEIKLSNMLMSNTGDLKLSDIGMIQIKNSATIALSGSNTMELRYMAPECLLSGEKGCAQDIWSLGCAVIEMCSGKHSWDSANAQNIADIFRLLSDNAALPDVPTDRPAFIVDFIRQCVTRDIAQRTPAEQLQKHAWFTYPAKEDDCIGISDATRGLAGQKSSVAQTQSTSSVPATTHARTLREDSEDAVDKTPVSPLSSPTAKAKASGRKKKFTRKKTKQTLPNAVPEDVLESFSACSTSPLNHSVPCAAPPDSLCSSSPSSSPKKSPRRKTAPAARPKGRSKSRFQSKSGIGAKRKAALRALQDADVS